MVIIHLLTGMILQVASTCPENNILHLKIDAWKTILSFWCSAYFQGQNASFKGICREVESLSMAVKFF